MSSHADRLAELTGLDDETIKQQIIPYLSTFTTKQTLVNHLQDLVGPGSKQNIFINAFADERFPPAPAPSKVTKPSSESMISPNAVKINSGNRKTKAKFPSKLPPPRTIDANSFNEAGSVYRKLQENDASFGLIHTGSASRTASPSLKPDSSSSRPEARTLDIENDTHHELPKIASTTSQTFANTTAKPLLEPEYIMIPSEEMRIIQESIALLRGDVKEDPALKAKPCFCQGRRHALNSHVPLCLSCGLILCSIMSPSPLLLPSPPCPSCAAPILSTTSRAILLAQLDMTLASLTKIHQDKIEMLREERQQAWKEKRKEVELFPELQQQIAGGSLSSYYVSSDAGTAHRPAQQYNAFQERRRNIDIAMGRKVEDDNQRRSRVLRIESKAAKGKGAVSKKKKQDQKSNGNQQEGSKGVIITAKVEESLDAADEEDEETDELIIDYDYDEQGNGPLADADDDGFAQHSSYFPAESIIEVTENENWARRSSFLPVINYIPEKDRIVDEDGVDEQDFEEDATTKSIPGSAPKEGQAKVAEKTKSKKSIKPEK